MENIMETILIIITIVMSIIIGILTTLKMRYKKNLKSEINFNYLIDTMCNVDILHNSKGEFTVKEDKYIFVDPTNSYCVVINDEGEYMIVEKNKLKSMATAKEIKE